MGIGVSNKAPRCFFWRGMVKIELKLFMCSRFVSNKYGSNMVKLCSTLVARPTWAAVFPVCLDLESPLGNTQQPTQRDALRHPPHLRIWLQNMKERGWKEEDPRLTNVAVGRTLAEIWKRYVACSVVEKPKLDNTNFLNRMLLMWLMQFSGLSSCSNLKNAILGFDPVLDKPISSVTSVSLFHDRSATGSSRAEGRRALEMQER